MPIRINLLADAIAAEEERRRDPVKRGSYVAGFLAACVALWAVTLQAKIIKVKSDLKAVDTKLKTIERTSLDTLEAQRASIAAEQQLAALHEMSTNRFLWGNVLQAFQQVMAGSEQIQMLKLRTEQTYSITEGTPARTNGTKVVQGKPATATERIGMVIEGIDTSPGGRRVNPFKESIGREKYFAATLATNGVILTSRSAPQTSAAGDKTFVNFSLKATFPEKTR